MISWHELLVADAPFHVVFRADGVLGSMLSVFEAVDGRLKIVLGVVCHVEVGIRFLVGEPLLWLALYHRVLCVLKVILLNHSFSYLHCVSLMFSG